MSNENVVELEKSRWLSYFAEITETDPVVSDGMQTFEDKNGVTVHRKNLYNVNHVLTRDQKYQGRITYDEFSDQVLVYGKPLMDTMCTQIAIDLSKRYFGLDVSTSLIQEAVVRVSREHAFHPVKNYLKSIEWDGIERASRLFLHYFGASHESQNEAVLLEDLSRCFMVSAVARIMQPGCKVDTTPILYGGQGRGKSTAIRILASGPWFSDTPLPMGHKDFYQQLHGVWLYEIAELDSFRRAENTQIKSLLSSTVDRYRPSYGRNMVSMPRQTVFVGTTNNEEFLRDETGSRRFWPVETSEIRIEELVRDRDQLWAEALQLYRDGVQWWLGEEQSRDLRRMSERFRQIDPWEEKIATWVNEFTGPKTTRAVLTECIGMADERITRTAEMRVSGIFMSWGWQKRRMRIAGSCPRVWSPPGEGDE